MQKSLHGDIMKKRTLIKDSLRNIQKKWVSFLSVIVITAMAVIGYLGLGYSANAIKKTADEFYISHDFRDLEVYSNKMLSEDDIAAVNETEGIALTEAVRQISGSIKTETDNQGVYVTTLTERINRTQLLEGSLPLTDEECAIEKELSDDLKLSVGDTITVNDDTGEKPAQLKGSTFRITGIVFHPDHYVSKGQIDEMRYVLVKNSVFDSDEFSGRYTKLLIKADYSCKPYSSDYFELIESLKQRIEQVSDERKQAFDEQLKNNSLKYDEAKDELLNSDKEIYASSALLDKGKEDIDNGKKEIESNSKKLENAKEELSDGKAELDKGKSELDSAEKELDRGKYELDNASDTLSNAYWQLDAARESLDEKKQLLEEAEDKLKEGEARLREVFNSAESAKSMLRDLIKDYAAAAGKNDISWASPLTDYDITDVTLDLGMFNVTDDIAIVLSGDLSADISNIMSLLNIEPMFDGAEQWDNMQLPSGIINSYSQIYEGAAEWKNAQEQYINGKAEYDDSLEQFQAGEQQYQDGLEEYRQGYAEYESRKNDYENGLSGYYDGKNKYLQGKAEYDSSKAIYDDGKKQLDSAKEKLEDGEKTYEENKEKLDTAISEYEDGKKKIEQAGALLEAMQGDYKWLILNARGNAGFYCAYELGDSYDKMGLAFGIIFIMVGVLVIYSSIARMVHEQHKQIGTVKALGFNSWEILEKYLIYAVLAVVTGLAAGIILSYTLVQSVTLKYNVGVFVTKYIQGVFTLPNTLITVISGLLLSSAAAYFACNSLLTRSAKDLLSGLIAHTNKKKSKSPFTKIHMPLYLRMIIRNIKNDIGRVVVTIFSVSGCCMLIVVGLTFTDSLKSSINIQYDDIIAYDYELKFNSEVNPAARNQMTRILDDMGAEYTSLYTDIRSFSVNGSLEMCELVSGEPEKISQMLHMKNKDGNTVEAPEKGIIVPERLCENSDISTGDSITLFGSKMETYSARVSEDFINYFGQVMVMSHKGYEGVFGNAPKENTLWIKSHDPLPNDVKDIKGFVKLTDMSRVRRSQDDFISAANAISWMLIGAAGLMAYFIILDLVNMYVLKKKRELIIMRINGFTVKETVTYAALECAVTTFTGIIIGLVSGSILGDLIISLKETNNMSFIHKVSIWALLISAALTLTYSVVMHIIAFSKIRKYDISDLRIED